MDQNIMQEDKTLDRRSALRALFGFAVVAAGAAALLTPNAAEASPAVHPELPATPQPEPAAADLARDEDLPDVELTYHRYWHRPYRRRVVVYRRRPVYRRRVYYRRRRYY